jgi:hypothetical protein
LNGTTLSSGDAAAVENEEKVVLTGTNAEPSEILLFDLA